MSKKRKNSNKQKDKRTFDSDSIFVEPLSGRPEGKRKNTRAIEPKTDEQRVYAQQLNNQDTDLIVVNAAAGTGKTYMAVAKGLESIADHTNPINTLVLMAPEVSVGGEREGFLPGTSEEKSKPYLMAYFDHLHDLLGVQATEDLMESGHIRIEPIGKVRGRSIRNAFIILDEAQNCTIQQAKTVGTRPGKNSRLVICGDVTQCDLDHKKIKQNALEFFMEKLGSMSKDTLKSKHFAHVLMTTASNCRSRLSKNVTEIFDE